MCKYYTVIVITIHSYHKVKTNIMDDKLVKVFFPTDIWKLSSRSPTEKGVSNGPSLCRYRYNIMNEWDQYGTYHDGVPRHCPFHVMSTV